MTNEILAIRIKYGENEYSAQLWEQVKNFICKACNLFYSRFQNYCIRACVTREDLYQEGFLALMDAVNAYNPAKGYSLLAYISYPLRTRLNQLVGFRTAEGRNYLNTQSLDKTPSENDENLRLCDILPDESAEMAFLNAEERIYAQQLHRDLDACLSSLEPQQKEAIEARYYYNNPIPGAYALEKKALIRLRTGPCSKILKPYEEDIICRYAYNSSYTLWKESGYSSTEYAVMKLDSRAYQDKKGTHKSTHF